MKLLTQSAVAELLGVNRHKVGEWFKSGTIAVVILPGMKRKYVRLESVQALIIQSESQTDNSAQTISWPQSGPTEDSKPRQTIAKRTNSRRAKRPGKWKKGEWRQQFR